MTTTHSKPDVAVFGELVEDLIISLSESVLPGTKHDCRIDLVPGGGAVNAGCHLKTLGHRVSGILLTGSHSTDSTASRDTQLRLPDIYLLPGLERPRRSVLMPDGTCYTDRPSTRIRDLPANYIRIFQTAPWTLVAPTQAANNPLVRTVLHQSKHTVLLLSASQLTDSDCVELMRQATVVVLNEAELRVVSHCEVPLDGLRLLREQGVQNVIVTGTRQVLAWDGSGLIYQRAFRAERVSRTIGAGDCFAACLIAGTSSGRNLRQSIRLALAGAGDYVEGVAPANSLEDLETRAASRTTQLFRPPLEPRRRQQTIFKLAAMTSLLLVPVLWAIL